MLCLLHVNSAKIHRVVTAVCNQPTFFKVLSDLSLISIQVGVIAPAKFELPCW